MKGNRKIRDYRVIKKLREHIVLKLKGVFVYILNYIQT